MGDAPRDGVKVYRCPECFGVWPKEDPPPQGICPDCGVKAERKIVPLQATSHPVRDLLKDNPYDLEQVIVSTLKFSDAVSHAAFFGQEAAEKLSERSLEDGDEFIDAAQFNARIFNRRAQMVADMLATQKLLVAAGLGEYVQEALSLILNARIAPNVQVVRQEVGSEKSKP